MNENGVPTPERFVVTSVTGFPIMPNSGRIWGTHKPPTRWYVLDSAYCFRIVASYISQGGNQRFFAPSRGPYQKAMELAAELNAWDEQQ